MNNYLNIVNSVNIKIVIQENKISEEKLKISHLKNVNTIIQKSEVSLKDQLKLFVQTSGKHLAIGMATIVTFLITGQIIPESLYITTFVLIPIIVIGMLLYSVVWFSNKSKNELRSDLYSLAVSHKKLGDEFSNTMMEIEKKLFGRIKALETYTPYGIMEIDSKCNVIRVNPHFQYITGWNENTLNQKLQQISIDKRAEVLAEILTEKYDEKTITNEFRSRISGEVEAREYKDLYLKHRNGKNFPASIRTAMIQDNNLGFITQYFISDDTDLQSMMATIQGQNDTINRLITVFTTHQNEKQASENLIKELEAVRGEIYDKSRL